MFDTHQADRLDRIVELLDALSDMPVTAETDAWFIGHTRNAAVLELRLAGLVPDARPITRSNHVAAWASRRHSATIVYWPHDGALELTLDDDLDQAITTILNDVVRGGSSMRPADNPPDSNRYGQPVSEPVITRVVAIEDLPPGSRATRRVIAEWSDGSQSEAFAWFCTLCRRRHKSHLIGKTREQLRWLHFRRDPTGFSPKRTAPAGRADPPPEGRTPPAAPRSSARRIAASACCSSSRRVSRTPRLYASAASPRSSARR